MLAAAAALINLSLRAKFLKFTTQIYKWNDFPGKVGGKGKGRGKTILKAQPTLAHPQVFFVAFCNQLAVGTQKGKKSESNQVLLLDQVSRIIKSLRQKIAVHNHLHPEDPVNMIDRLEIKPEIVPSQGHFCRVAPCYDEQD